MNSERILALALKHVALVASLAVVALAVLRVFFFSGFSIPVGLAVLSVADRASVLASTLLLVGIAFVPAFVGAQPAREWLLAGNADDASLLVKFRTALIWMPVSLFIFGVAPISLFAAIVLGSAAGFFLRRWLRRSTKEIAQKRGQAIASRVGWVWATATGLLLTLVLQQSWMPIERVELSDSSTDLVGYVVGEQGEFTLLLDRKKRPIWSESAEIVQREICIPGATNWPLMSAMEVLRTSAGLALPQCPPQAQ